MLGRESLRRPKEVTFRMQHAVGGSASQAETSMEVGLFL